MSGYLANDEEFASLHTNYKKEVQGILKDYINQYMNEIVDINTGKRRIDLALETFGSILTGKIEKKLKNGKVVLKDRKRSDKTFLDAFEKFLKLNGELLENKNNNSETQKEIVFVNTDTSTEKDADTLIDSVINDNK